MTAFKTLQQFQIIKIRVMEITLPIKSGSDVTLPKEPPWFKHMDSIFIETNAEVRLSSPTQEPWFGVDDGKSGEELNDSSEEYRGEHTIETYKQIMATVDNEDLNSKNPVNQETPKKKRKTAVTPHKKSKKAISNKQVLCETASWLKGLADSFTRQHHMVMKPEQEREGTYMAFRKGESEKNGEHSFV